MNISNDIQPEDLSSALASFFDLAGEKIRRLDARWDPSAGSPVFTEAGRYTARGWTEWTQGFQYGCQILQYDATGDEAFWRMGRENTRARMAPHLSHTGVHDHGFNNVSTYGNLRRLALEGRTDETADALALYKLALEVSGAVQASRWTTVADGSGFIHSFNGPHSLFSDTIRSCRSLMLAHAFGHVLMGEGDRKISLLDRAVQHIENTARYNVYYGEGRDVYDVPGRVAHEGIFNVTDGQYRCPSTQQGYSAFSTWTRGLAWILLGAAEQIEFLDAMESIEFEERKSFRECLLRMATTTADFYIAHTCADGIPFWDTGAPGLTKISDYTQQPSQPDNPHEPVDSSAAAIVAQGLLRLGRIQGDAGIHYWQAGLIVAKTLFSAPYLAEDPTHEGLILHSIYHRPNDWDYTPPGKTVPQGEASMWGDYHAMELAVYLKRIIEDAPYLTFFGALEQ